MEDQDIVFHGIGWSFPPQFVKNQGAELTKGTVDIEESLRILLSTRPGERVVSADYGCDLSPLLYEPLNLTLKTRIKEIINVAILHFETRIELLDVDITESSEEEGLLLLAISYEISGTNSRYNLVFPFYKNEGSING